MSALSLCLLLTVVWMVCVAEANVATGSSWNLMRPSKRQLVIGRIGFRPGRSLAIGRATMMKPTGKRADQSMPADLNQLLLSGFQSQYCSAERQQTVELLFKTVKQAVQTLVEYGNVCGSEDENDIDEQLPEVL